jgi:NAD(P)-dependent dehydrogenase (short-subunit alcohol dehydrogenase family)
MLRNLKLDPQICTDDFRDRLVVITGATSGIGLDTALKYASQGADILGVNRDEGKSKELCEQLKSQYNANCSYLIADFSNLDDVHAAAKQLSALDKNIDVLIHNAGVYLTKKAVTANNLEMVFQVNYLGSFILNYSLKDKFIAQKGGRIIFVNSEAHRFAVWGLRMDDICWEKRRYSGLAGYGAAKLAQLLSMIKFNDYFRGTGVTMNAMHPGNVKTRSGRDNSEFYKLTKRIFVDSSAKSSQVSAEALYYLGVSKELANTSGKFFHLTTEEEPAPPALDRDAAEELWEISLELGGLT